MLVCLSGGYDTTSVVGITQQTTYRDKAVTLFPNPTSGKISLAVSLERSTGIEVRILDLSGTPVQNMYTGTFEKGGHLIETQLNASLPSGVYFVEIKTDDARFREKLVLIR
jgi:DNA helicase TIP49 (TBP-interacting protein)